MPIENPDGGSRLDQAADDDKASRDTAIGSLVNSYPQLADLDGMEPGEQVELFKQILQDLNQELDRFKA